MEVNGRDGQINVHTDHDDINVNARLGNSHSASEEFSVGNLITTGGLKLTISCRTKCCENELDKNCNDTLGGPPRTNLTNQLNRASTHESAAMERESLQGINLPSENTEATTQSPGLDEALPTLANQSHLSQGVNSQSLVGTERKLSSGENDRSGADQDAPKLDHKLPVLSCTLELPQNQESVKQQAKIHTKPSDGSCGPEIHDPLLRMDTLPNVSPESGISSLDESPFGNESPDFGNNDHPACQVSSVNATADVKVTESVGQALHSGRSLGQLDSIAVERVGSEHSSQSGLSSSHTSSDTPVLEVNCSWTQDPSGIDVLRDSPVPSLSPHGNGVIVSSPHKIAQATGRKKRGRPPKTIKSLILKHKKSTLYNSSPDSCGKPEAQLNSGPSESSEHQASENGNHCVINTSKLCDMDEPAAKIIRSPRSSGSKKGKQPPQATDTSTINQHDNVQLVLSTGDDAQATKSPSPEKRGRGRPRKNVAKDTVNCSSAPGQASVKVGKRKYSKRKLLFTRMKRKPQKTAQPIVNNAISEGDGADTQRQKPASGEETRNPDELSVWTKPNCVKSSEGSVFQDNDLDALLLSVKSSIKSQFKEDMSSDVIPNLTFDNPFALMQPPPFPKVVRPSSPRIVKPKAKRPKLHVMMRQTKRRKKKFVGPKASPVVEQKVSAPPKLDVFSPVMAQEPTERFSVPPLKKSGTFGSSMSLTKRPFFTSCVQPSKILASSRLNVFRLGTGVNESHRAVTPPDTDAADSFERRLKKRHKLLYRKSKHKNIVDPVFAAGLDTLLEGLTGMTISENPADNFIRVRPGEMPLPSIFRVIKIDVNRKVRERPFTPEQLAMDKPKLLKSRKDSVSPSESPATSFRPILKLGRKKLPSDSVLEHQKRQGPVSTPCDQRLPPKKRHRMVNAEASQEMDSPPVSEGEPKQSSVKKKGKRLRKVSGQEDSKSDASQSSSRLAQHFVGQELTIDTSQGFLTCTPSLSPCASRLSTRSSTLPPLSSPSPTGSVGFRARSLSQHHSAKTSSSSSGGCSAALPLAALHSLPASTAVSGCAEYLLDQSTAASISPGSLRSGRLNLRSLSGQQPPLGDSSLSSEPSPNLKLTPGSDKSLSRSRRKRRRSSNLSGDESDSSPPTLECISPQTNQDSNFFSEPPNITTGLDKNLLSPKSSSKSPISSKLVSPSTSRKKASRGLISKRKQTKKAVQAKKQSVKPSPKKKGTSSVISAQVVKKSSRSVITMSCPEHEPLPLEHCSDRKLVEEIKAATTVKSCKKTDSEEESGAEDTIVPSPVQPPRKRYQRVGLFSDFYKDAEPRKRCENMVRCRERLTYDPCEHEHGLMPQPLHIGQFYLRQQQDFQLPYDIWWQHVHQQLPKKPEPKIKFRNIRTNLYSDSKVNHRKLEIPLCNCKLPQSGGRGCQDDCLNRMIYTECSPSTCPLGEDCGNQRIQKHEWAPGLVKVQTKDRGIGVVTKNPIKTGQFILEYLGEVVSETEFRRRMMEEYSEECHHYALHLDSGSLIDGYRMGNIGRYVNHACRPNCEMQKWNVNGLYRMVLFALRDIEAGEELSYDYNFDPFNQETQQECRCGSSECRGVIGGKRSLNTGKQADKVPDDYKDKRKSKCMNKKLKDKLSDSLPVQPMAKPMTLKERCYARKHRTFLVRNVDKIRNQSKPGKSLFPAPKEEANLDSTKMNVFNPDLMLAALNERSVKTRLAAYAEDNPELARRHHLAQIFDEMLSRLLALKDADGYSLVTPLMALPSKKKQPQYYTIIREPIAMSMIKDRVKTGFYNHLSSFHADLMLLFSNVELYCGPKSDLGQVILKLRQLFDGVKLEMAGQLDEVLGPHTTRAYMDTELVRLEQASLKGQEEPEEDIIRCICGVTRDEGLMLMCEKCSRWQHCDCVRASGKEEHYLCDRCEPRYYDPEILLVPPPSDAMPDCTHYMTLVKDEVQYAVGDCVYVMRDCKRTSSGAPLRTSHRLLATCSPDKLDVFRLDQLWKDPKGERFASGTPYLRPQETFHEPTRKFFHNELFRTPSFEIIPMDLVMGKCIVMDPNTFSKGRPKGFKEQDVYVCEHRVDKTAHLFHKIQKIWYPINTSKFCFDWFDKKLNMKRTYSPHEVPEEYKRKAPGPAIKKEEKEPGVKSDEKPDTKPVVKGKSGLGQSKIKLDDSIKNDLKLKAEVKVNVKKGSCHKKEAVAQMIAESNADQAEKNRRKRLERKARLDKILTKLLNSIPGKQKIDLTYLLEEEKRIRKKITK